MDVKDKKILYQLDLNCRQSNTQIGKKVGLKRDVVAYRINNLINEGVIKNFWTAINTFKLGYNVFRIYINYQYISTQVKEEIINHFVSYNYVWAVISLKAEVDLDVIIWVKDIYEFYRFWDKTLDKFEDFFAKYTISIYIEAFNYKKSFLLNGDDSSERLMYQTTSGGAIVTVDETDFLLLNAIAINARIPLVDLAEKLDCSSQSVNYRLKNLIENGIIKAFRVNVNLSKLGFKHYKLDIYLKDHTKRRKIWNHLKNTGFLDTLNVAVGWSDLECEIIVKDFDQLSQIMEDINSLFPGVIKKQSFWIAEQIHKERWLPEL